MKKWYKNDLSQPKPYLELRINGRVKGGDKKFGLKKLLTTIDALKWHIGFYPILIFLSS